MIKTPNWHSGGEPGGVKVGHSARKMESTIACSQAINIFASNSSQLFASKGKVYAFAFYMSINAYLNLFLFVFFRFSFCFSLFGK